jgi:hypothetical protein
MPGVEEVTSPFGDAVLRRPRFIVLSEGWAWRYLNIDPAAFPSHGRMLAPTQRTTGTDQAATAYFHALMRGEYAPYRLAYTAQWTSESWPPVRFHASTSRAIWIFEAP